MKARKVKIGNVIIYDVSKIESVGVYQGVDAWFINVNMPKGNYHDESFPNEAAALKKLSEIDAIIEAYRSDVVKIVSERFKMSKQQRIQ